MKRLIAINQHEKDIISAKLPKVHIVRTMKNRSNRHRYYMVEDFAAMRLLRNLRGAAENRKGV
jgi:hypothetical protein